MPTTSERAREILEQSRHLYRQVPHVASENVCPFCLGPVGDYRQCYSCHHLFVKSTCPAEMEGLVVPMSIVITPSAGHPNLWYSALKNYKLAQWREYAPPIAALAYVWLEEHAGDLADLLGGQPDLISIVPSKREGVVYETQPLRRLLLPLGGRVAETLRCVNPSRYHRTKYAPEMFEPAGVGVAGKRIVLVEDTWITGATALSAAGALLDAGAALVVITPIARAVDLIYQGEDHPYLSLLPGEFDVTAWPR